MRAPAFFPISQPQYHRSTLLQCNRIDYARPVEICGLIASFDPFTQTKSDFRSLPSSEWRAIHSKFVRTLHACSSLYLNVFDNLELDEKHSDDDLLAILCSFAEAVQDALERDHHIDFSRETAALKTSWTSLRSGFGKASRLSEPSMSAKEVLGHISAVPNQINGAFDKLSYFCVIPEFDINLKDLHKSFDPTFAGKQSNSALMAGDSDASAAVAASSGRRPNFAALATPAWTGLTAKKSTRELRASVLQLSIDTTTSHRRNSAEGRNQKNDSRD